MQADSVGLVELQIPSSSRGSGAVECHRAQAEPSRGAQFGRPLVPSADNNQHRAGGPSHIIAAREGGTLPEGYKYTVRDVGKASAGRGSTDVIGRDTVDLSTPPDSGANMMDAGVEAEKRTAAARKNATKSSNRQAIVTFAREVKDSLAEGRPPVLKLADDDTHLKARWHTVAKEVAYKFLDLRKESWKSYSIFDKGKVHKELNAILKFDPPLDATRIDKYLAGHLRSARAVWKAHWQRYGPDNRHHNCPEEAWATLIKWWPTEKCKEESAAMASRRSLVQRVSRNGRKALVDRMAEEVRDIAWVLHAV